MGQLGDLSPAGSVAVGIVVGLLSTSIQSIGLTLQRKSHLLEDSIEDEVVRRPPYKRRRWQIGMFLFVIANLVGSTIQITTLPLPVLSTLQSSGLVFNTICATILLREPFTKWSLIGTVLVAGGAMLIALFGALPEPSHTLDQLLELLNRGQFIAWMVFTFLAMILILASVWYVARVSRKLHRHADHLTPRARLYVGMAFGFVSAVLSSHSLLVAKSAVELIVRTVVDHRNQFDRFQSWLILVALLFFALTQLVFLHKGLRLVSTSVLYPFVFCIYNIVAILNGLIYFRQVDRIPALHAVLIALGTVIVLAGVFALSWRLNDEPESTAPPADAHSLLTPGMGIVEDLSTEDEAETATVSGTLSDLDHDEEAPRLSEVTPLLGAPSRRSTVRLLGFRPRRSEEADRSELLNALEDRDPALAWQRRPMRARRASTSVADWRRVSAASSDEDDDIDPSLKRKLNRAHTVSVAARDEATKAAFRRRSSRQYPDPTSPSVGRTRHRRMGSLGGYLMDWWRSSRTRENPNRDNAENGANDRNGYGTL